MKTLFESLARHRAEWLAQGLFVRAVETEPRVRELLMQLWNLPVPVTVVPEVTEEEPTDSGWRADVCIRWPGLPPRRVELKLLAGFTPRQFEALAQRRVDAVIVLAVKDGPQALPTRVIEWRQLAELVETPVLKQLLREVGTRSVWLLEQLSAAELNAEYRGFASGDVSATWERMYRFLSTVHEHLLDMAPDVYRASDGWTQVRRGAHTYYGFCFYLGEDPRRFWLGFWHGKEGILFGATVPSSAPEEVLFSSRDAEGSIPTYLNASDCAAGVLQATSRLRHE